MSAIETALGTSTMTAFEYSLDTPHGPSHYEDRIVPISTDEVLSVIRDITDRKNAERKLMESLAEKELLLKEVHHRVKNNMQVISSLLNMQASEIEDKELKNRYRESQSRVRSMALVHEKLYRSHDLSSIELGEYVRSMMSEMTSSSSVINVRWKVNSEPFFLGVDKAVPVGLIVHELVSNAIKHAFHGADGGEVVVDLARNPARIVSITVRDNGVGMPAGKDLSEYSSMGMVLVMSLAEQLSGSVALERGSGSRFVLTFPD
jgi:two-component sensor histidine kinase